MGSIRITRSKHHPNYGTPLAGVKQSWLRHRRSASGRLTFSRNIRKNWRQAFRHLCAYTLIRVAVVATTEDKRHAAKIVRALKRDYPDAACSLRYESPLQLLIATILSAQCTDQRVNIVTQSLFKKYKTAEDFARLRLPTLERAIQSTGFFRNKAKNIRACCRELVDKYDGRVPDSLDELVELAGVGRKTANVVLGTGFGIASGVVVDTHVGRISRRTGLTEESDAVKVEYELGGLVPRTEWIALSHRMIQHGRKVCQARRPNCEDCSMKGFCPRNGVD